ncbi:hypothetical protein [Propionispora hippei]|uniref:ATP-grasp domain-containing protein n=1 Tax=Propionispora hippei DSM 15287 TaxID=1123003 RepID=A0A1M6CQ63_9FIRM|nr:hypothetical protein [Propionispora hippei]SHI63100.1 hypothetical protein SAMN02745170_00700 [Propionispora hippei DSM 15287]
MNIIILSPDFSHNVYQFCLYLRNLGVHVLGIGDTAYDQLSQSLTGALTEYYKVDNLANYDEVLRAAGYFTHKYGKINRIENINPRLFFTEAALRTDFHVPGVNLDALDLHASYTGMKKLCRKARVNTLVSDALLSREEAAEYAKKTGYPVIAKPDSFISQAPCTILQNEEELNAWLDKLPNYATYVLAPHTKKAYYSFDGLLDASGAPAFTAAHVSAGQSAFYSLRDIPEDLAKTAAKLLAATNAAGRFFHIRFSRNEKNKLFVEELLLFPGNGFMPDIFNFANDINVYQEWANMVQGDQFSSDITRKFHCAYIARSAGKDYAHKEEEIRAAYDRLLVATFPQCGTEHQAGSSVFLARSEDQEELLALIEFLQAE